MEIDAVVKNKYPLNILGDGVGACFSGVWGVGRQGSKKTGKEEGRHGKRGREEGRRGKDAVRTGGKQ